MKRLFPLLAMLFCLSANAQLYRAVFPSNQFQAVLSGTASNIWIRQGTLLTNAIINGSLLTFTTNNGGIFTGITNNNGIFTGITNNGGIFTGITNNGGLFTGITNNGGIFTWTTNNGGIFLGITNSGPITPLLYTESTNLTLNWGTNYLFNVQGTNSRFSLSTLTPTTTNGYMVMNIQVIGAVANTTLFTNTQAIVRKTAFGTLLDVTNNIVLVWNGKSVDMYQDPTTFSLDLGILTAATPSRIAIITADGHLSNGVAASTFAGIPAGTVVNTGTPAVGDIANYTDTTGTNVAPNLVTGTGRVVKSLSSTQTNVSFYGSSSPAFTARDGYVLTNDITGNWAIYSNGVYTIITSNNAATSTRSTVITNSVPATVGAQKASGSMGMWGNGWGTTGGASLPVGFEFYVLPTQAGSPTANLIISNFVSGLWFNAGNISSGGALTMTGAGTFGGTLTTSATGLFSWLTKSAMKSSTDGNIEAVNAAGTTGATLHLGTLDATNSITMRAAAPLSVTSGTNQRAGNAVLVGGTVTINNTTVTANTLVMLSPKTASGTLGTYTYTLSAGASFTINSSSAIDTSTISYFLIEVP